MPTDRYVKPIAQRERETWEKLNRVWRPYHEAMDQEEAWLDGERYEDDSGLYNRDRRRIQIRGQETQDTIRHIIAKATERKRTVTPKAIDRDTDPDAAEYVAELVEWELGNPQKGFDRENYAALMDCCEKRAGCVWMDWDPDCGPYGELIYSRTDFRNLMYSPEWHPHHYNCGTMVRMKRLNVELARDIYGAEWLEPDRGFVSRGGTYRPGVPLIRGTAGVYMGNGQAYDDDDVTIWEFWHKNDKTSKDRVKQGQDNVLPRGERYLVCLGIPGQTEGCGYRSPTQDTLGEMGKKQTLPAYLEQGCPQCMEKGAPAPGDLERIDAKALDAYERLYKNGRRLVVLAPLCRAPGDEPLKDGGWPIATLRSFPGLFYFRYVKGGRPMGPSDTALMWDQQAASDNLRTMAAQRVFEHRAYYGVPRKGIVDYKGRPFKFKDDQFNHYYYDAEMGPNAISMVQGSGLDPQFSVAFNIVQQALTTYRGMNDLGPVEERSKAKSGVALKTENAIGEVPVADFIRRNNGEVGIFYGLVWDGLRATLTPEKLARVNLEGMPSVVEQLGDDLPGYDFWIEDAPEFSGLDKDRSDAWDGIMNAFQQAVVMRLPPLPAVEAYSELNQIPRSVLRKFEKMLQQAQPAPMMGPGGGGPNGGPGALGTPPMSAGGGPPPPMNGNPSGMVPQVG